MTFGAGIANDFAAPDIADLGQAVASEARGKEVGSEHDEGRGSVVAHVIVHIQFWLKFEDILHGAFKEFFCSFLSSEVARVGSFGAVLDVRLQDVESQIRSFAPGTRHVVLLVVHCSL
ncbi:MAG: hypothetical protein HRJ53_29485 [Acidobacteria bacterium Pan2503]|uniref:Uncharacterized protein n=1 Tax=Candidatus Acidiferrum panamense TaxID=2741543 RepID=A0A7V8T0G9_9BACT|nr:hypothetical protein [Candidatus Acidoferrum panamensis]